MSAGVNQGYCCFSVFFLLYCFAIIIFSFAIKVVIIFYISPFEFQK